MHQGVTGDHQNNGQLLFGNIHDYHSCHAGGIGHGKNMATCQSTGLYLLFLDADDVMFPTRLEKQLQLAAKTLEQSLEVAGNVCRRAQPNIMNLGQMPLNMNDFGSNSFAKSQFKCQRGACLVLSMMHLADLWNRPLGTER